MTNLYKAIVITIILLHVSKHFPYKIPRYKATLCNLVYILKQFALKNSLFSYSPAYYMLDNGMSIFDLNDDLDVNFHS